MDGGMKGQEIGNFRPKLNSIFNHEPRLHLVYGSIRVGFLNPSTPTQRWDKNLLTHQHSEGTHKV